jgi:hypothetical protein
MHILRKGAGFPCAKRPLSRPFAIATNSSVLTITSRYKSEMLFPFALEKNLESISFGSRSKRIKKAARRETADLDGSFALPFETLYELFFAARNYLSV